MAEFVIKLADERGHMQEQVHTAASAEELRTRFTHAGYHVFSVRMPVGFAGFKRRKVKLEPFLIFNQQFLTLIKAGLPILGSLQMLGKIQKNAAFAGQLEDVANRVKTGESLSAAFEAQSGFPVMYTTTLLAGERSGNLTEVLERYVSFQKVSLTFRKKLIASLIYPALLMTLVIGLMIFMLAVVVPQFAVLYDQMGSKLPAMTMGLLAVGKWLNHNIFWLFLVALGLAAGGYRYSITDGGRDFIDGFRIRLPIFGNIWIKYQVALFSRTLSTLLTGGLPLVPSLETAARSISRARYRRRYSLRLRYRPRGQEPGRFAGTDRRDSRPGRGDDYRGRADRRPAADAQLGGRVLRGGRGHRADRRAGAHRAGHPHHHGRGGGLHSHLALPAHLLAGIDCRGSGVNRHGRHALSSRFRFPTLPFPGARTSAPRLKPWRTAITPSSST
jgi:type IV pilus assembly protein PilC